MDEKATRMLFATVALSALAVLLAGPAHAYIARGDGVNAVSAQSQRQQAQVAGPGTIPYLSQGIGVDKSLFSGRSSRQVAGTQQAPQPGTIPYLSQGQGVDKSLFSGRSTAQAALTGVHAALQAGHEDTATAPLPHGIQVVLSPPSEEPQSLGLTGDSALARTALAPEPVGLTGDSAATRYPGTASNPTPQVTATSSGSDLDWTSFGAGAAMVALLGAGLAGALLTVRKRHSVGLP
jgi:hypothetical protein